MRISELSLFQWIHLISSMITLIVMILAAIQALRLLYQDYNLRHIHLTHVHDGMPNLETMEQTLFRILKIGFFLLSGIIVSSFYFFYAMRSEFLVKLSLSLTAWVIFAGLLWWRYRYGLRGRWAIIATLSGVFIVLGLYLYSSY